MANDPYWNSVVLAMHMDDTGLTDLKGHAVTLNGNAARSSAQSKFGGYSAVFDGKDDCFAMASSTDWVFGTGDFTIEFWLYRAGDTVASTVSSGVLLDLRTAEPSAQVELHLTGSTYASPRRVALYVNGADRLVSTSQIGAGFSHIAVARNAGVTKLYINGVAEGGTYTDTNNYAAAPLIVGRRFAAVSSDYRSLNGYIDDLRITKGVSRYTANFTVPAEAFPNTPPQLSGTVKDSSGTPVSRVVRAYRRSDGVIGGSAVSSASDGAFSVSAYDGSSHYVVCLDDDLNENALIFDNLTPV